MKKFIVSLIIVLFSFGYSLADSVTYDGINPNAKIDDATTNGLLGVNNSLAYRVHEIEKHFHNTECWRGILAPQTATEWAKDTLAPFIAISGADTWGADADDEAQVLGTADTPFRSGKVKFNVHRVFVDSVSHDTIYKLRIVWGTGTMDDAVTAEQFSCIHVKHDAVGGVEASAPIEVMTPRLNSGVDKIWVQAWNATDDATVSFLIGIHEYDG